MFSIHTSIFNVIKAKFDWKGAFENWLSFLSGRGQLVIAINKSDDGTPEAVRQWVKEWKSRHVTNTVSIDVLDIDIPYTQPDFDGKGKAAALAACKERFCILLDIDERLVVSQRRVWATLAQELEKSRWEGFLIPSIDVFRDEQHYRCDSGNLRGKWYLHKNLPHLTRGVVKWAWREDGSFDKTKSDSCELCVKETYELAKTAPIIPLELPHYLIMGQLENGEVPFVYHIAALDLEQRVRQSAFWRPIWDLRDQHSKEPELTLADLDKIKAIKHRLPSWKEGMDL